MYFVIHFVVGFLLHLTIKKKKKKKINFATLYRERKRRNTQIEEDKIIQFQAHFHEFKSNEHISNNFLYYLLEIFIHDMIFDLIIL